jgi:uncharacterized membrane protein
MMCMMMHMMDHGEHSGHDMQEHQASAPQQGSLLDVLRRRYALGEINLEQFQEMQRVLGLSGTSATAMADHGQH